MPKEERGKDKSNVSKEHHVFRSIVTPRAELTGWHRSQEEDFELRYWPEIALQV
jgi:hypothetical protein